MIEYDAITASSTEILNMIGSHACEAFSRASKHLKKTLSVSIILVADPMPKDNSKHRACQEHYPHYTWHLNSVGELHP